jgi:hypothetical protein
MTDEKWEQTLELIKKNYQVEEENQGTLPDIENARWHEVIFDCPMGKFKMTRTVKPRVINKNTHYSNRIGSGVKVDYQYSKDDFVDELKVLKWNEIENDWINAKFDL